MIRFVIFISAISLVSAGFLPPLPPKSGRIIGGESATIKDVPYQVAVLADYSELGIFELKCGGAILKDNIILTSAHCTDWENPEMRVRAGSTTHNFGGQLVNVTKVKVHDYFGAKYDYDFAVLYLDPPLTLDGSNVAKIDLPYPNQNLIPGSRAQMSGWGAVVEGGQTQTTLSKVTVPIVDHGVCEAFYASYNPITPRMICAGNYATGGIDFCRGDDGGPLVLDGTLIGIASFNYGCAKPNYPGVYSNVASVVDWLNQILSE